MSGRTDGISLTRWQVREIDRRAIDDYGLPGIVLMENAARNAAQIIVATFPPTGLVAIVCGRGNNGGDGFAIARHLANAGFSVELFLACDPEQLAGDAATNQRIVEKMRLNCHPFHTPERMVEARCALDAASVIVDAVLGTGFTGEVRPPLNEVITAINAARQQGTAVVAVDVPSGLDCDTGRPSRATVEADLTITFVARKAGFENAEAGPYLGRVCVVDIGVPIQLIQEVCAG